MCWIADYRRQLATTFNNQVIFCLQQSQTCWQSSTDTVSIFIGYGFAQFLVMENSVEKEGTPCVLLL